MDILITLLKKMKNIYLDPLQGPTYSSIDRVCWLESSSIKVHFGKLRLVFFELSFNLRITTI